MIKIAIAEDLPQLAEALRKKVELGSEFKVKFSARNGAELISFLNKDQHVDVVLMDIKMPEMNGIKATEYVTSRWPQIKVIMCTVFTDEHYLFDAVMVGATGYLLKDEPPAKIHRSIYEALEGGAPMSKSIALKSLKLIRGNGPNQAVKSASEKYGLTAREIEVLEHLSKGNSYENVADNLNISYGTVRKHVENCYRKLRVHGKVEAINKMNREGYL